MSAKPHHKVSEEFKLKISALKSFGTPNEDIANYLGISLDTLKKFYKYELDTAQVRSNAEVANKLYKKATVDEDLTAIIFWLKTRARWSTEDSKQNKEVNEEVIREMKELRAKLDAKNKKDY